MSKKIKKVANYRTFFIILKYNKLNNSNNNRISFIFHDISTIYYYQLYN